MHRQQSLRNPARYKKSLCCSGSKARTAVRGTTYGLLGVAPATRRPSTCALAAARMSAEARTKSMYKTVVKDEQGACQGPGIATGKAVLTQKPRSRKQRCGVFDRHEKVVVRLRQHATARAHAREPRERGRHRCWHPRGVRLRDAFQRASALYGRVRYRCPACIRPIQREC